MPDETKRRGLMLVLSSPSGAGKTTLSRRLLAEDPETVLSISTTTRPKRPGETDGADYTFVDRETFEDLVSKDAFLEFANVFGHSYGTPRDVVEAALEAGKDVLFDIDWQGTQQLAQKARSDLVRIFILPPTMEDLHDRLVSRGQDTENEVQNRMSKAQGEMSHWAEYDYVLINRDLEKCLSNVKTILKVERMRRSRQVGLTSFVKSLTGG
ncbi:MAG: guanylate kinase [Alphaproteobacteria bacterium]|nr:MAG: guanylate kinase [Alphaproteobacteria bacterium]